MQKEGKSISFLSFHQGVIHFLLITYLKPFWHVAVFKRLTYFSHFPLQTTFLESISFHCLWQSQLQCLLVQQDNEGSKCSTESVLLLSVAQRAEQTKSKMKCNLLLLKYNFWNQVLDHLNSVTVNKNYWPICQRWGKLGRASLILAGAVTGRSIKSLQKTRQWKGYLHTCYFHY